MKPFLTILEPEHFSERARQRLTECFQVIQEEWIAGRGRELRQSEVVWTRFKEVRLNYFEDARLIACNMTDVSHLPLDECQKRGIEVLSLKGIEGLDNVHATAEHTISLILQALRHRCDRTSGRIGRELREKKVGVVGLGRIGQQVRELCESFGAEVYFWNAMDDDHPGLEAYCPFVDWVVDCDIVTMHLRLSNRSKNFIDAYKLKHFKPGCILVNTARHAIVDGLAVLEWLERDKEAIYAHDFVDEWSGQCVACDNNGPYEIDHDRIIGTPHIGGWTIESLHKTEELLAEKVIEWAKAHTLVEL